MSKDELIKGEGKQEWILLSFLPSESNIVKQDPQVFNGQSVLISNFIKKKNSQHVLIMFVSSIIWKIKSFQDEIFFLELNRDDR